MNCIQRVTFQQLAEFIKSTKRAEVFIVHINEALSEYEINSKLRIAAFLGQLKQESGSFRYTQEIASGKAYEGRADLGNTVPGDGEKFKGRGLIQITGRNNYRECSLAIFDDYRLFTSPELLSTPHLACISAGWFWQSRGLNELADKKDYKTITKRINGGLTAYEERLQYYNEALKIIG